MSEKAKKAKKACGAKCFKSCTMRDERAVTRLVRPVKAVAVVIIHLAHRQDARPIKARELLVQLLVLIHHCKVGNSNSCIKLQWDNFQVNVEVGNESIEWGQNGRVTRAYLLRTHCIAEKSEATTTSVSAKWGEGRNPLNVD